MYRVRARPLAIALLAAFLIAPLAPLAAAQDGEAPNLPPAITGYTLEFRDLAQRLAEEMNVTVPALIEEYNATQPRQLGEALQIVNRALLLRDRGDYARSMEFVRLYYPLVARMKVTAEAALTNETESAVALRHGDAYNASSALLAEEAHKALVDAQGKITTVRSLELLILAGTFLAEGEQGRDGYGTFRNQILRSVEAGREARPEVIQGVVAWSYGPSVLYTAAIDLAGRAVANDSKGTTKLAPTAIATLGPLSHQKTTSLIFQPLQWFGQEIKKHAGTNEHVYMAGLYITLNATLVDNQINNQLQSQTMTYSELRTRVQDATLRLERARPLLQAAGAALHTTEDALGYYRVLQERYAETKGNTTEALKYVQSYQKAAHLLARAQDTANFLFAVPIIPQEKATTELGTEGEAAALPGWAQLALAAVAGGAVVGVVVAVVLSGRKK